MEDYFAVVFHSFSLSLSLTDSCGTQVHSVTIAKKCRKEWQCACEVVALCVEFCMNMDCSHAKFCTQTEQAKQAVYTTSACVKGYLALSKASIA